MKDSVLLPGLRRNVETSIRQAQSQPANQGLPSSLWNELTTELSDPRTHFAAGVGHVAPSAEQLGDYVAISIADLKPPKAHQRHKYTANKVTIS